MRIGPVLFTRFSALSLSCILALALAMSVALSALLTRAVTDWEWQNTAAFVRHEVRQAGLEGIFEAPGDLRARHQWGPRLARELTSMPEIVRAKVWSRDAEVLWSDEPELIGRRFVDNEDLRHALAGKVEVEIKAPHKSEHQYEQSTFGTLAEVYVPILGPDGRRVLGVVEIYKIPDLLFATIRWGRMVIWTISVAGAIALHLVLLPLFMQVYRRQVEDETLRAHAASLEAEVTERTEQLLQAQKLEAIGRLAGGVAHDFNNLLTVITGRCQLLRLRPSLDPDVRRDIGLIESTSQRAAGLTRQLLAFGRKQELRREVLDLNTVVAEMAQMLRRVIGEDVALATVMAPSLGRVNADRVQLEQVVLNLAVNARDAMPDGGQLTIQTANIDVAPTGYADGQLPEGRYVLLAVRDTGRGMDAETQARIFEPFFTTKAVGKGTGLGLSIVHGVVQQHAGRVFVRSAPGAGTTFEIYLPSTDAAAPAIEIGPELELPNGTETVLVVEDEDPVRAFVAETLRQHGYTVLVAADGESAERVAERWRAPIDLLLTDGVMPRMSGWELSRRLGSSRPGIRVLYMTGHLDNPLGSEDAVLFKPFSPAALLRAVRTSLGSREPIDGGLEDPARIG